MHYVRAGRGAPQIVFVHGFACSHADWQFQFDFFSKTNAVIACDLRGHGETPGRPHECSIEHYGGDVAALVDNLEFKRAVLIGHSMGCRVVLEANRLAPDRVAGIVLVDGSRLASGDGNAAQSTARAAIDKLGYAAFAENLFRQMFFRASPLAEAIVARAMRQPAEISSALWPRLARWDAAETDGALAAVRSPVLVMQSTTRGAQLRRSPLRLGDTSPWLELLRQKLNNVRIEIVPGVGHFPQLEAAATVNRLIRDFLMN